MSVAEGSRDSTRSGDGAPGASAAVPLAAAGGDDACLECIIPLSSRCRIGCLGCGGGAAVLLYVKASKVVTGKLAGATAAAAAAAGVWLSGLSPLSPGGSIAGHHYKGALKPVGWLGQTAQRKATGQRDRRGSLDLLLVAPFLQFSVVFNGVQRFAMHVPRWCALQLVLHGEPQDLCGCMLHCASPTLHSVLSGFRAKLADSPQWPPVSASVGATLAAPHTNRRAHASAH